MPEQEWQEVWDARLAALERLLGPASAEVWHSIVPSEFGGHADVLQFQIDPDTTWYVTAELTGSPHEQDFELALITRGPQAWAAPLLSELGHYHLNHRPLGDGHTMDMAPYFRRYDPKTTIAALLFTEGSLATPFEFGGREYQLLLATGITSDELASPIEVPDLIELLDDSGIGRTTDLARRSVLEGKRS